MAEPENDHFATSKSWASVDSGDTKELLWKAFTLITFAMSAHKPGEDFKRYAERWLGGYDVHCGARSAPVSTSTADNEES